MTKKSTVSQLAQNNSPTSFESAMTRLGGGVVSINQITSSIAKGESLGDTGIHDLKF